MSERKKARLEASIPGSIEQVKQQKRDEQERRLSDRLDKSTASVTTPKTKTTAKSAAAAAITPSTPISAAAPPLPEMRTRYYDSFILDCDGVMWHGDDAIEGSIEACQSLLAAGCKLHFVTNSSVGTRDSVAQKLGKLGLTGISAEFVTTSGSAAATLIRRDFPGAKRAYVIGEQGLLDELRAVSLEVEGGPEDTNAKASNPILFTALSVNEDVDVVVCGLDRSFNYAKLAKASLHLQRNVPLVCTNYDAYDKLPSKGHVPGAGCLAAALRASHPSVEPRLAGKPSGELLIAIMASRGMEKSRTVMVGDRVDTDLEFAMNAGINSCLVLTGVSSAEHTDKATQTHDSLFDFVKKILGH